MRDSFIAPTGRSIHDCGYCHSKGETSISYGLWAFALTANGYQRLIDSSWRRSGKYTYRPTMNTCCPAYTIRLNTNLFQLSKSQKKTIKKMRKYVMTQTDANMTDDNMTDDNISMGANAAEDPVNVDTELCKLIQEAEGRQGLPTHKMRVEIVPSEFDQECYDLYCKYQMAIHKDPPEKLSVDGYTRFLIDSPIVREKLPSYFPGIPNFGSYHQKYYLDNKLMAVAVLDILPKCVSSVYFFYDPEYSHLSLGVYAALREIALTQSLNTVLPELLYYYMGYYIHSCSKMRYKSDYKPSELLCPYTQSWVMLSEAIGRIEINPSGPLCGPDQEFKEPLASNVSDKSIERIKIYCRNQFAYLKDLYDELDLEQISAIKILVDILKSLANDYIIVTN